MREREGEQRGGEGGRSEEIEKGGKVCVGGIGSTCVRWAKNN